MFTIAYKILIMLHCLLLRCLQDTNQIEYSSRIHVHKPRYIVALLVRKLKIQSMLVLIFQTCEKFKDRSLLYWSNKVHKKLGKCN
ncbi:hypothetical protein SLEP1_g21927 [Rubroshorea leprosula]|uniref:Secreted protein n=1 Tax=Rubroshorea leprosula TaxID=152421 RepID=A0AAV5J7L0_9ROSI|nr:hypothetical protein SLEP1_g21927 [Rubroshorea leprosula]